MSAIARKRLLGLSAALLVTAASVVAAVAQTPVPAAAPKKDAAPAATSAKPPVTLAPTLEVTGFRSAKFGMNEADVRAAMTKDFNVKPDAIKAQDNAAELTHSILLSVPELLPNGGTAELSYVFGYKSKSLIQIGAVWSKGTDAAMTAEKLFSNANILRAHFMGEGFKPDSIAVNMPVAGGIVMFRGSDAKDRSAVRMASCIFTCAMAAGLRPTSISCPAGARSRLWRSAK